MKTYAAIYKNEVREKSSSGGIFSVFAKHFEVVYGVAMTKDCYGAEMIRVEEDISSLRGSKYLQAKVGDSFRRVKEDLLHGKTVLFSGTGCQINGLKGFLGREYDNLICVDVVCHGVPSPKLWKEYVKFQEHKYGKLEQVNFRAKDECWKKFGMKENQRYIPKGKDPFMNMFLDNFCLRPSCYTCCAKEHKLSDISIADFWGIERVAPEMNDGMGTSLIIVRTEKGQELFDKIKGAAHWQEVDYNDAIRENPAEYCSVERPSQRDSFFFDLQSQSFNYMIRKYAPDTKRIQVKILWRKVKSLMKKEIKNYFRGGVKIENSLNYGILFTFSHEDR